ncbi:MAG: L-seryl-tRNA(Sec) selenium transferase, partial [Deltaproteobacteria bacterium]|nr:L-seryl-tRNA(Sec) selenium transferase [Deltaproteobacteria bacterium]
DKLLGGPQAGIILGKKEIIDQIKKNPITRALRIDKLTLAALESTLRLYRDEEKAVQSIPTLRMLLGPFDKIEARAAKLAEMLEHPDNKIQVEILDRPSKAGGGSLPLLELPSKCVSLKIENVSTSRFEKIMRGCTPPVIGRIEDDCFIMDMRTVRDDELEIIRSAVSDILKKA